MKEVDYYRLKRNLETERKFEGIAIKRNAQPWFSLLSLHPEQNCSSPPGPHELTDAVSTLEINI